MSPETSAALSILVACVPQFRKDLEIVSYLWLPLVIDIRVIRRAIENLGERGPRGGAPEKAGRGWWTRDAGARAGDVRSMQSASSVGSAPNRTFRPITEADF